MEGLTTALQMEVDRDGEGEGEVKEEGDGTQGSMGSLYFLTQDAEPRGTTLVDAHNGFNDLIPLVMLWTVRHLWPVGARFAFNFYRRWAQLLLRQLWELPVIILSQEGVTQGTTSPWICTGSPSSPWLGS